MFTNILVRAPCCLVFLPTVLDVTQVQWDSFLQRLDDELQLSAKTLDRDHPSKCVSPDTSLVSARTGEWV